MSILLVPTEYTSLVCSSWTGSALTAAGAIASFRRRVMEWEAKGQIDNGQFLSEVQHLDDSGLSSYVTRILADLCLAFELPESKLPKEDKEQ